MSFGDNFQILPSQIENLWQERIWFWGLKSWMECFNQKELKDIMSTNNITEQCTAHCTMMHVGKFFKNLETFDRLFVWSGVELFGCLAYMLGLEVPCSNPNAPKALWIVVPEIQNYIMFDIFNIVTKMIFDKCMSVLQGRTSYQSLKSNFSGQVL